MARDGLDLLRDTLGTPTQNTKALGRSLLALTQAGVTVNGQPPDNKYPVGEYLIHGGRIKYDLRALSEKEQNEFYKFITNDQATPRRFATHRFEGADADGCPSECKSGLGGAVDDLLTFGSNIKHSGVNIAVGGTDKDCNEGSDNARGLKPKEDGQWGHMYFHHDKNVGCMMIGIEGSEPGKHNLRTGQGHSTTGQASNLSAFLEMKHTSDALRDAQRSKGNAPLNGGGETNWATVKITPENFSLMKKTSQVYEMVPKKYAEIVGSPPKGAVDVINENARSQDIQIWVRLTNKMSEKPDKFVGKPKDYVIEKIQKYGGSVLKYSKDKHKSDPEVVLEALKSDGRFLKYANENLRDNQVMKNIAEEKNPIKRSKMCDEYKSNPSAIYDKENNPSPSLK